MAGWRTEKKKLKKVAKKAASNFGGFKNMKLYHKGNRAPKRNWL